jgi:hypothetical protein
MPCGDAVLFEGAGLVPKYSEDAELVGEAPRALEEIEDALPQGSAAARQHKTVGRRNKLDNATTIGFSVVQPFEFEVTQNLGDLGLLACADVFFSGTGGSRASGL